MTPLPPDMELPPLFGVSWAGSACREPSGLAQNSGDNSEQFFDWDAHCIFNAVHRRGKPKREIEYKVGLVWLDPIDHEAEEDDSEQCLKDNVVTAPLHRSTSGTIFWATCHPM